MSRRISRRVLLAGAAIGAMTLRSGGISAAPFGAPSADHGPALTWYKLTTPTAPPARRDHTLTYDPDRGMVYLFGGRGAATYDDLWAFDTRSETWQQLFTSELLAGPAPRFGHNAAYDGTTKRLVVYAGQAGPTFFNDAWAYDFTTSRWSLIDAGSPPQKRYGAAGGEDPATGRAIISHGFTDQGRFDDTWILSNGGWTKVQTTGPVPMARCLVQGAWEFRGKRFFLFGGQSSGIPGGKPFLDDFWSLDVEKGIWTELTGPRPGARNFYGAAYDPPFLWTIFGGNTATGLAGDTWQYDIADGVWTQLTPQNGPSSRSGQAMAWAGDRIYLFGGSSASGPQDDTWQLGAPVIAARLAIPAAPVRR